MFKNPADLLVTAAIVILVAVAVVIWRLIILRRRFLFRQEVSPMTVSEAINSGKLYTFNLRLPYLEAVHETFGRWTVGDVVELFARSDNSNLLVARYFDRELTDEASLVMKIILDGNRLLKSKAELRAKRSDDLAKSGH